MTNNCEYCEKSHKTHVDGSDIFSVIDKLDITDRAKLVTFINQVENQYNFHTTLALEKLKQICTDCGEWKAKEDDDDRYYYVCDNNKCSAF